MIKTGNRNFWIAQGIGWGTLLLTNLAIQMIAKFPLDLLIYNTIAPLLVGFGVTAAYRYLIRRLDWRRWNLSRMIGLILGSSFLLTSVFVGIIFILFSYVFRVDDGFDLSNLLSNFFIFGIVMFAWNVIYFCIHYFNNWNQAEIEKWKLAAEIKDAQLGSLKSQINPHFVFNALNNIRSLILEDKEKAREMLQNFSDLFRYALKNTDQAQVTLSKELEIVHQYLELLSIQYEDKLKFNLHIDTGLENEKIPPMMLQILVENAVKHGISQFKEGGAISIHVDQGSDFMNVVVKNTGSLKLSSKLGDKLGVGLDNIRKRLDLIYNGKANLSMKEVNDQVVASIKIPTS